MKNLCITGSAQRTLDKFAIALLEAGAKAAAPASRGEKLTIGQWHQKVLMTDPISGSSARLQPGRTWDKMAVDIFYANDKFPLWFWADENSVKALNYWLEFDTATQFVFVHTSPQVVLVDALEEGKDSLLALEHVLQEWCVRTQEMLSVHMNHPKRSVFIDSAQASRDPGTYIQALAEHWQLSLQAAPVRGIEETTGNCVEHYLIGSLLQRYPHATELHNEICARQIIASVTSKAFAPLIFDQILSELLKNKRDMNNANSARQELEQRLHESEQTLLTTEIENAKALAQMERENKNSLRNMQEVNASLKQEKLTLQSQFDEYVINRIQDMEVAKQAQADIFVENELLLNQLHYTQEDLELHITIEQERQIELKQLHTRIQKIFQHLPHYWEIEDIQAHVVDNTGQNTIQWNLKNVYLDNCLIPTLDFQTRLDKGIAGLVIQRSLNAKSESDWLRWPSELSDAAELPCIPSAGGAYFGQNAILSGLSTSSWGRLQLLIKHLIAYLEGPVTLKLPAKVDKQELLKGLKGLLEVLAKWPMTFRFDDIHMIGNDRGLGYNALGIRLSNLSLGEHRWPIFDYRVATVDQNSASFGQNPRFEFHEASRSMLEHWYAESQDSRGSKLELRFAKPDALDINIWRALSEKDRLLIAGLVSSLPMQLSLLQQHNPTLLIAWQDWQSLSKTLREILAKNLGTVSKRTVADIEHTPL